ncbi:hypothetical protein ACS0TY_030157 [Phlomoides rotata]
MREIVGESQWDGEILKAMGRNEEWFFGGLEKEMGDGVSTFFWEDVGVGEVRLNDRFSRLFNLSVEKGCTVTSMRTLGDRGGNGGGVGGGSCLTGKYQPRQGVKDQWWWTRSADRLYSSKRDATYDGDGGFQISMEQAFTFKSLSTCMEGLMGAFIDDETATPTCSTAVLLAIFETSQQWRHHREGWKTENGFKIGYLNLSTYMKQVFPNTNLKPEPHINSRITVWKRNYHSLFEILKNTGVGLDSTTNMIEATDEQWDAFMKKDPNTRLMRSKSWPLYDDWCGIFDQSRVIGETAESHLRATTPPPSFSANIDVDDASFKVGDEKQDESKAHIGCAQTGESTYMGKTSSGRKRKSTP